MPQATQDFTTTTDPFALGGVQSPQELTAEQALLIRMALSNIKCPGRSDGCATFVISLPDELADRFIDEVIDKISFDDFEAIDPGSQMDEAEIANLWHGVIRERVRDNLGPRRTGNT